MFNMIIVDDEPIIIESLSPVLKEMKTGFNLVASFTDPKKALCYIENNTVDLVITDIKMPKLSGVELAKEISKNHPQTKIIFLTAYSEIKYAQQAIKYNAGAYLLKPIDMAEFTEALEKVKIMLLNSENGSNYSSETNSMPDIDIPAVRKILANFLADDAADSYVTYIGLKECGMDITENSSCAFVKLYLEDLDVYLNTVWVHGLFRLYDALNNCFTDDSLYIIPTAFSFDTIDLFVVSKRGSTDFFKDISSFFDSTVTICADVLNLTVQLEMVHTSDSISKFNVKTKVSPITDANLLFESIVNHTPYKLPNYCDKSFDDTLLFGKFLVLNFSEYCNDFINTISPMLGRLSSASSIDKLKENVSDIIAEITSYFDNRKTYNEKITQLCIDYINLHYGENISLTKISNELNISTSQLSKIFKKTLKVKYVDYLNTVRLEKAKELLRETNQSVKTISSAVGYTSYPYFLRVFKIHTGKTPLEYRTHKNGELSD